MHALSLHQVIAKDAHPREIIRTAHALGCQHVCLFTQGVGDAFPFHVVQDHEVDELRRLMDGLGISVLATTTFPMTPTLTPGAYSAGLERSERLGSRVANVRFLDDEPGRLADNFAMVAELAGRHGIELSIEYTGFGKKGALDEALAVIRHAGRGKISIDPLHIMRTGTLAGMQRLGPDLIGYVQFCDGVMEATAETYAREGGFDRLPPGEGEFPLLEILALVPPGAPISLEVPQEPARLLGVSVMERCRRAVDGMRNVIRLSELAATNA